jgi:competence protein ComGC
MKLRDALALFAASRYAVDDLPTFLETLVRSLVERTTQIMDPGVRCERRLSRGFTLIDVLVTLAVVVILIALLLPSLGRVRETAHQVICRSNVRQIGIGISMYAEDNSDRMMSSVHVLPDGNVGRPWDTSLLRLAPQQVSNIAGPWDGVGRLYQFDYLPAPKLFYCPSHHGRNGFRDYEDEWAARSPSVISGNYQYRGRGPLASALPGAMPIPQTLFLSQISPGSAILADSMRTKSDFNHRTGTNVLRANNSVDWYGDSRGRLISLLPREGEQPQGSQFESLWRNLDEGD